MIDHKTDLEDRAAQLLHAERTAETLSCWEPRMESDLGYAVQAAHNAAKEGAGDQQIGWKIGLTSPAAQAMFVTGEPMRGVLHASTKIDTGTVVDLRGLCARRLEGEILLRVDRPPAADATDTALLHSLASIHAAFEIADSRFEGWNVGIGEAIADNACCALFGFAEHGVDPLAIDLPAVAMSIRDSEIPQPISAGFGANCLGTPLAAYRWLVRDLARSGDGVRPGEIILTGALGPMVDVRPATDYTVALEGMGSLRLTTAPLD